MTLPPTDNFTKDRSSSEEKTTFVDQNPLAGEDPTHRVGWQATEGETISVDPDIADQMGAFVETALSDEEAQLSLLDMDHDALGSEEADVE